MADPNELKAFQDIYDELSKPALKTPEYWTFLNKLNQVNEKMSALYQPDNYGRIPLVTQADKEELVRLHEELGLEAEDVLKNSDVLEPETLDTIKKLSGLNNAYTSAMRSYDPGEKKALHTIHEEMRTPVIDTRNTQLKAQIGGSISRRQPLTFLDPSGKEISGVFIPEKYETGPQNILVAIENAAAMCHTEKGKQLFLNMVDHFKDQIENEEDATLFNSLYLLGTSLKNPNSNPAEFCPRFIMEYIKENMSDELDGGTVQNEIGSDALVSLSDALNEHYHSMVMNRTNAMIEPDGRVDTRNAAMSSVAELLNVPNIIARSKPMQIIDADGNKVNGTFMTAAEGMDPDHLPPEAEKITIDAANKTDGKAFKSIADLQVLDYICGNIDRHPSNFFMKFDKKGKLADIQGIDNDCSCGKIIPEFGKGFNRMVGLKDLMVMSESMCNKVKDMTPAQLKFALRGYGLSEAEMNAACERLRHIKAMITKYSKRYPDVKHPKRSSLLIVPDDQFKNLKLDELALEKEMVISGQRVTLEANMFAMVKGNLEKFKDMRRDQERERIANERELHTLKSEIAIGSDNRANPGAIVKNAEQAEKLNKEMGKRTNFWKFFWKTSPAYERMEKATQDYFKYQRKLKERLELAKDPSYTGKAKNAERNFDWEAVVSREDMEKMRDLARKMYDAADAYCDGKKDLDPETASPYQKKRLEIGKMSREFARKAMAPVTEKENQTLEANEKLAHENEERTAGNKKEAEDRKKGGPAPQA